MALKKKVSDSTSLRPYPRLAVELVCPTLPVELMIAMEGDTVSANRVRV